MLAYSTKGVISKLEIVVLTKIATIHYYYTVSHS